jgi:hypothetical protein
MDSMITGRADVAVYDRKHRLVLVVETKSRFDATARWAGRTFRNRYVHGHVPNARYFLLALPDFFYLWKEPTKKVATQQARSRDEIPPDHVAPAGEIIRPYLGDKDVSPHEISTYAMKMIVSAWVADLINSDLSKDTAPQSLSWVFDSGLYGAIKGGTLGTAAAV